MRTTVVRPSPLSLDTSHQNAHNIEYLHLNKFYNLNQLRLALERVLMRPLLPVCTMAGGYRRTVLSKMILPSYIGCGTVCTSEPSPSYCLLTRGSFYFSTHSHDILFQRLTKRGIRGTDLEMDWIAAPVYERIRSCLARSSCKKRFGVDYLNLSAWIRVSVDIVFWCSCSQ